MYKFYLALLFFSGIQASFSQINTIDTRLMHSPAMGTDHIAFIYANDLWVAGQDGENPKRLTVDNGIESNPVFSPDGKTIAFSAEYEGNTDVYTVSVAGGVPKRLTYHPYPDLVRGFSSDGQKVLFLSQREVYTNRIAKLYTVDLMGGHINALDIPQAFWASYSPNGDFMAYTPLSDRFTQWKHYRGGTASRIWIYDFKNHEVQEIPKPAEGSNDAQPQWMGDHIYFKSDRNGEFNIYSYEPTSKKVAQLTDFKDFPVLNLSARNGRILFEQNGYLHSLLPETGQSTKLTIGIAADLLELRPRFVSNPDYVRSTGLSPTGARAVIDYRGDIVTLPAEKGDPDNRTQTPGSHETFPSWSPDSKHIAYFSDASGEYELHIKDQNSTEVARAVKLDGTGFYAYLDWSPDSEKITFVDNGRNLWVVDVKSGKNTKIAQDILYTPGVYRNLFGSWSADSDWIAYTIITETNYEQAYLYSLSENKSHVISDALANVSEPTFDPSGKYLYLTASTDAGPVVNWFDQSNQDMRTSNSLYLVTLQKEVESPFAKENDVEKIENDDEEDENDKKDEKSAPKALKIDWDGIRNRIVAVSVPPGNYSKLAVPLEGKLYYVSQSDTDGKGMLNRYDLAEQKNEELFETADYVISANGEKMLYRTENNWFISETGKKAENEPLNLDGVEIKIDPKQEWSNIFNEAWRVNRDYFYDPGMHGVDWEAMHKKYSVFLKEVPTKDDLYRMMGWMFSELAVGHHRFDYNGDAFQEPKSVPGGLLGADYTMENNRYKIKKIYGGLNWNPDLRAPLTEPGVDVKEGDYIIEINGKQITTADNLYLFFENTAGKLTFLTVSANANGSNSRTVQVTPTPSERALRNRDWVEGNIKKVDEATNGQVAYVYVPNTAEDGHEYFKRYFYPQATKKAIIVDERFNGGGQLADYVIDLLKKPKQANWNFRYGKDLKSPSASIQGPKVMLIDETAGSGGDYLPWMFRKFEIGTLVGKRTWGGLVGVLGYPEFIDGGMVTAPNIAFYTEDGFRVENEGVPPDVEVEQLPKSVIDGHDPQLEKAIEIALKELRENPPKDTSTPDYPNKTGNN
ncbi:S41 family peptidase [Flavimarina sp. Hel_I_48]|uniref:S41 family peptidase n=1 Tax=Flavimarina sp. Hel_I_48 TaxID=1392488 RepID=UPI0005601053|nr:S41 family peptidase [Flavimarina sp. Hel_I_48]